MKKTMMYLPEEMHAYLAREAGRRGLPMAEIAREAIAEYRTARESTPAPDIAALIGVIADDGPPVEIASRADEVLAEYFSKDGTWEQENRRDGTPRRLDASILAAAASGRDTLHDDAVRVISEYAGERMLVPVTVLTETMCLIRARHGIEAQRSFWDGFDAAGIEVISTDDALLAMAREIENRYADAGYGFVDTTLLAACEMLRCARVLSFDRRLSAYRPSFATALDVLP